MTDHAGIGMHFDDTVEAGQPRRSYVLHHNIRTVASSKPRTFCLAESDGDLCATSLVHGICLRQIGDLISPVTHFPNPAC